MSETDAAGDHAGPIRVFLVDDQQMVRAGFWMLVDSQDDMAVVGEAGDGGEALERLAVTAADVVLMDVRMPRRDGIEATRDVVARHAGVRVLVLTTVETDEVVYEALRAGASGFLLKSSPREQLWQGIAAVAAGDALLAPSVTRRLIEDHLAGAGPATRAPMTLTGRQTDVVRLVARGMSNREIADRLHLAETTVKGYLSEVLVRHSLRDRTQLVVFAHRQGVVSDDRSPRA